jgi:aerobic-type carbon monoxide dehydrogenase small subunit (CoxS/CutS family)
MKQALTAASPKKHSVTVTNTEELYEAVRNAAPAGVIKVASGTYDCTAKTIASEADGTADAPITLCALDPNDPPVLAGQDTEHGYVLHMMGDWWVLDGLVCTNCQKGIVLDHSDRTVIQNCELYKLG